MRSTTFLATTFTAAVGLLALAALLAPGAAAQQAGGDAGGAPPGPDAGGGPPALLRTERATRIVPALEAAIARARKEPVLDAGYLKQLEDALEHARALTKAVHAAELSEDEKTTLRDELGVPGAGPGAGGAPGGQNDWVQRTLERAFDGAELTEEEESAATPIISEWYTAWWPAWQARDTKTQSDLKRDRDEKLEKAIGKKKARKVINNLNSMGPGKR